LCGCGKAFDNQRIANQYSKSFSVSDMNRWLAPPKRGIIEARQVIMYERRAVEELDRASRSQCGALHFAPTGLGNGKHKLGPDTGTSREDGVM
jgi:hypothetical protein